ncbi:MAG: 23S rRNA (adenine(2503)-C(2))-methyltransferase RlmN [Lentisphaeria bacterium]|nr:23S rRNA (adenine(2503)-C(2))-methyltransferase RlmN [Lentisphaeria bacterium]
MTKSSLLGLSLQNLKAVVTSLGQPAFRAKQLHEWIYKKHTIDFQKMNNLSADFRNKLDEKHCIIPFSVKTIQKSKDGTIKYLFECQDGELMETVYMPTELRRTICFSSQIGCAVGCVFCASGKFGIIRNLSPSEIAAQILFMASTFGKMPTNIVAMGMGEPLLNTRFEDGLKIITSNDFLGLGARHVTVSTSGIVPGIRHLADAGYQWNLAVSIHAPDDEARSRIIPDKTRYSIDEILEACRYYREKTRRKVTFEYTLVKGENDSKEQAIKLAKLAKSVDAKINVIPLNDTDSDLTRPTDQDIKRFVAIIEKNRAVVTVRYSRGEDIAAACGQLAKQIKASSQTTDA